MENMFKCILKRNGAKVPFNVQKITNAVYKASLAVGQADWKKSGEVTKEVLKRLEKKSKKGTVPTVEEVQDIVEKVLIESGQAKVAKAYILYRQHRAEIRQEKAQVLHKEEIDEVDKKFDVNALRVLAARYLKKNDERVIVESPKELFTRVSVHGTLPSLFYDEKIYKKKENPLENFKPVIIDASKMEGKLSIGKYQLNRFHLESLVRLYNRFASRGQIKLKWEGFLKLFKNRYFDKYESEATQYYDLMVSRRFMPNTPAIANFGNYLGMGSACFVLGIEDSIDDIMDKLKAAAIIFKAGGGVGYNFSKLRPEGDYVKTTGGVASGPLSFMTMFDNMTDVIKQGGIRRGANMGIINSNHPDILKFIKAKEGNKALRNFNISTLIMGDFWKYLEKKEPYPLLNPRSQKIVSYVDPKQLFDAIVYQAWESAEPGVIFEDKVNEYNPFYKYLGPIVTTNPCGEVLLYPFESCNLGSLNVWAFVEKKNGGKAKLNWEELEKAIKIATRFLDNVVDVNLYPLEEIEKMTHATRKLGLGVMGVADTLYEMELPYDSKAGLDFMERLMEMVNYHSKLVSIRLAKERGPMPYYEKSFYKEGKLPFSGFGDKSSWHFPWDEIAKEIKKYGIRNGYTTVIAPTGSISMIAGCSSGIEPVYSLVFEKHVTVGNFYYVDPVFEERMQKEGLMDDALIRDVAAHQGSVTHLSYIPQKIKNTFITAHDIIPKDHIKAMAAFQRWTDSSISKTNNFPANATVDDVKEAYLLAYKLGCKGVTVYRDGSIISQVLVSGKGAKKTKSEKSAKEGELVPAKDEKAKGLAIYKEASANPSSGGSLGISPILVSNNGNGEKKTEEEAVIDFTTPSGCKTCNLG
jgi:ribonucleoside-diphosphate reductase alpha chain